MSSVPQDFYAAVIDTFLLERAILRAKKMPQGYLKLDDILDEPMMKKVVEKYGVPQSRYFLFEMARTPRKNPEKILEYDHANYLRFASSTTRNITQLPVRPVAHKFRDFKQQLENQWARSKAEFEASQNRVFNPNAQEFVPASVRELEEERESNRIANAMFKPPPTIENISHIWNRNKTARRRKNKKSRKSRL